MRKFVAFCMAVVAFMGCSSVKKAPRDFPATAITQNLKFCEGSVAYDSSLLISNFGTSELDPLNTQGKGYVAKLTSNDIQVFIPADGNLSAPKGMAISGDYIYIADVGKVVIYNLGDLSQAPQTVVFPEGNLFVNDIVVLDNYAYISVTNTGKLFRLDISTPSATDVSKLSEYTDIVGANGLLLSGSTMYVASYPADGKTTADNVIYVINNLADPIATPLISVQGQYDGLAIKDDKLFFSNWMGPAIGYVDLKDKTVHAMSLTGVSLTGPADITYLNGKLYIPNLPSGEVVVFSPEF